MSLAAALFSQRWWWVTLLVLALMAVLARLGVWQLDRLEQRRSANAILSAALAAPPVDVGGLQRAELDRLMENQQVTARGNFDFERQVLLKVQNWEGRAGVHLITPLVLTGEKTAVLVDRGWIPDAQSGPAEREAFNMAVPGPLQGYVALSQELSRAPVEETGGSQAEWYRVDVKAIESQLPYQLLPFYIVQSPDNNDALPYRLDRQIDLSEGPHLSYAIQWFIFSVGLGVGYVAFVNKSLSANAAGE